LFFGLWILKKEELHGEENRESKFGPVATVAAAFFSQRWGQDAACRYQPGDRISEYRGRPFGGHGRHAGGRLYRHNRRPGLEKAYSEKTIKWISASIFILFGLYGIVKWFLGKELF